jgi:diacylglycerol kinase family enzyme
LVERYRRLDSSLRVYESTTLARLDEICAELAADPPAVVAVSGGDGTLSLTVTALRRAFGERPVPRVLPLRGGTMNMVANSVGTRGPVGELRAALQGPEGLVVARRETLVVEGRTGFIFGVGLVTNFLDAYYAGRGTGPWKAALVVLRAIWAVLTRNAFYRRIFGTVAGRIEVAEREHDGPWTAVLVQTIENLGIGFRPCYRALAQPGSFHLLATGVGPGTLVRRLSRIFRGRPWPAGEALDRLCARIRLRGDAPFTYTLDGELYRSDAPSLEVAIGRPVEFVRAS